MSDPYVGEIRLLPYTFAPNGWQRCDGTLLAINTYSSLFSVIGTTYGGDGQNTFAVPDLRGRVPLHQGQGSGLTGRAIGQTGGVETVTLTTTQMAPHTHAAQAASGTATSTTPGTAVYPAAVPASQGDGFYATSPAGATTAAFPALQPTGGNQPHDNTAPTLVLQYCIATDGVYPTQS